MITLTEAFSSALACCGVIPYTRTELSKALSPVNTRLSSLQVSCLSPAESLCRGLAEKDQEFVPADDISISILFFLQKPVI